MYELLRSFYNLLFIQIQWDEPAAIYTLPHPGTFSRWGRFLQLQTILLLWAVVVAFRSATLFFTSTEYRVAHHDAKVGNPFKSKQASSSPSSS